MVPAPGALLFSCVFCAAAISASMSDLVAGADVVVDASSNSTASAVVRNASAV